MSCCAWQTLKLFLQETVPVEDPIHVFCGVYAKASLEETESIFASFLQWRNEIISRQGNRNCAIVSAQDLTTSSGGSSPCGILYSSVGHLLRAVVGFSYPKAPSVLGPF